MLERHYTLAVGHAPQDGAKFYWQTFVSVPEATNGKEIVADGVTDSIAEALAAGTQELLVLSDKWEKDIKEGRL